MLTQRLCATADSPREVQRGGGGSACGQDELPQRFNSNSQASISVSSRATWKSPTKSIPFSNRIRGGQFATHGEQLAPAPVQGGV
jgi:hypothetical protein